MSVGRSAIRPRGRLSSEVGQSLVEFAIVVPIFLMIVMATVDFGWALRGYITATNSAREGARLGVVGATSGSITSRVVDTSAGLLDSSDVAITNAQGTSGSQLTVAVSYTYHFITPLPAMVHFLTLGAFPSSVPVSTATTMRIE